MLVKALAKPLTDVYAKKERRGDCGSRAPRLSHEPTEKAEQGGEGDETLRVEQGAV